MVDIVKSYKVLPTAIGRFVFRQVRDSIFKCMGFDIEKINPMQAAKNSPLPAIFIHGSKDSLVDISHSKQLTKVYCGKRQLIQIKDADHNDPRPNWIYTNIIKFLDTYLKDGTPCIVEFQDEADLYYTSSDALPIEQLTSAFLPMHVSMQNIPTPSLSSPIQMQLQYTNL